MTNHGAGMLEERALREGLRDFFVAFCDLDAPDQQAVIATIEIAELERIASLGVNSSACPSVQVPAPSEDGIADGHRSIRRIDP
jgi:hypothetical protein